MSEALRANFASQVERFDLRFRCRDCAHFAAKAGRCSMGQPTKHLVEPIPEDLWPIVICKYWELSEDA
jgi:hypothetical protein